MGVSYRLLDDAPESVPERRVGDRDFRGAALVRTRAQSRRWRRDYEWHYRAVIAGGSRCLCGCVRAPQRAFFAVSKCLTPIGRAALLGLLLVASGCTSSGSSTGSGRVLGVENDCDVEVEVTANNDPAVDQPTNPWVLLQPNSYKKAGTFTSTKLGVLIRLPDAEVGQGYTVETKSMVQVVGGEFDLLFQVKDGFCPK